MGFDKAENEPSTVCYKGLASHNYITWIRYSQPRSRLLSDRAGSAARRAAGRQAGTAASRHEGVDDAAARGAPGAAGGGRRDRYARRAAGCKSSRCCEQGCLFYPGGVGDWLIA